MRVIVKADHNIEGQDAAFDRISGVVETALSRFSDRITRVKVHLSDENSDKKGGDQDIRCLMEVRIEGRQPVAVTHEAATVEQAVAGAVAKMARLIDSNFGRLGESGSKHR